MFQNTAINHRYRRRAEGFAVTRGLDKDFTCKKRLYNRAAPDVVRSGKAAASMALCTGRTQTEDLCQDRGVGWIQAIVSVVSEVHEYTVTIHDA